MIKDGGLSFGTQLHGKIPERKISKESTSQKV